MELRSRYHVRLWRCLGSRRSGMSGSRWSCSLIARTMMRMSHADPLARMVLALAVLLASGKIAGEIAVRLRQPAVLGELVAGIVLGNVGIAAVDWVKSDPVMEV